MRDETATAIFEWAASGVMLALLLFITRDMPW